MYHWGRAVKQTNHFPSRAEVKNAWGSGVEHVLSIHENKVLRNIFGPKIEKMTG
jgi:hypothetical protein